MSGTMQPAPPAVNDGSPTPGEYAFPASFAQRRLWFIDSMNPGSATYNVPVALRLEGALNAGALARAADAMLARHEILRTVFRVEEGEPVQIVSDVPMPGSRLEVVALDGGTLPEERALSLAEDEARRPFDLQRGPLVRIRLVELGEDAHLLLVTMHHIITDGWSHGIFFRELAALYAAESSGTGATLAPLEVQYGDYAIWERAWLQGDQLQRRLAFWREQLRPPVQHTDLPTDRPRPAIQSTNGARLDVAVPDAVATGFLALCRREETTLFNASYAAMTALLFRLTSNTDVLIGTPIAGRPTSEVEGLLGFFVNTLVLRTGVHAADSFRAHLARAKQTVRDAFANQEIPFEKLVEELNPERDASRNPFFQTMLVVQHAGEGPGPAFGAVRSSPLAGERERESSKFDLTVFVTERGGGLTLRLEYSTDLFDAERVRRWGEQFVELLGGIVADPLVPLRALPLLSPDERRRILEQWSGHQTSYPRDTTIHARFRECADRAPGALAVAGESGTLTYGDLRTRADRLSNHLRRLGVRPADVVATGLPRSGEFVTATLGILGAGAAYLPLDPDYPSDQLAFMLRDSGATLLVTTRALVTAFPADTGTPVLLLDEAADVIDAEPSGCAPADVTAGGAAYVMYTSGSTGTPKGVVVRHRGVVRLVVNTDYLPPEAFRRVLAHAPVTFDASTLELWGPLLSGGTVLVTPAGGLTLAELGEFIVRERVETAWLTAALFHEMVDNQLDAVRSVRFLLAGGDVLSPSHVARLLASAPQCRLINGYGPTENTTFTCCHAVTLDDAERGAIPIGRPIANTTAYVLDAAGQPVPAGVAGELYTGGDGVAAGYHARAELTAERFVADPFSSRQAESPRMYRTGDRVRWRADGVVEFLGRLDAQVKIRGYRIEPGEVEAALGAEAGVRAAAVDVRTDSAGQKRLLAWVVAEPGVLLTAQQVRSSLRARLPEHMIPASVTVLDALPTTPSGKTDRRALPEPDESAATEEFLAPRTRSELAVAAVWRDVLGRAAIGVHENFFDAGGHSLLALRVIGRVADHMGVRLALRAIFEAPTIAQLAERIDGMRASAASGVATADDATIPRRGLGEAPLTPAQELLWKLQTASPDNIAYNVPSLQRVNGALDVHALARALDALAARQDVLRTTFELRGTAPVQRVNATRPVPLEVLDVGEVGEAERDGAAVRLLRDRARRPFDLAKDSLLRAAIVPVAADRAYLLLLTHHIVFDGWSVGVLARDFTALYEAARSGTAASLPPLPVHFTDVAAWQRERLDGGVLDQQVAYWRETMRGAERRIELPVDVVAAAESDRFAGSRTARLLPRELLVQVEQLARQHGASLYHVVLAAFSALLHRYSRQEDLVVGSVLLGREHREVEHLIGYFSNTLPLRVGVDPATSFRDLLALVREVALAAAENADVPYERIVQEAGGPSGRAEGTLFHVMFVMQPKGNARLGAGDVTMDAVNSEQGTAKFDLTLSVGEQTNGLRAAMEYRRDLFAPATIERMLLHLETLLEAAVRTPDSPVGELRMLTAGERTMVVVEWNQTQRPYNDTMLSHDYFERQVALTPNEPAVIFGDEAVSYRALDRRANALAHRLRALGVGPDSVVGIAIERSVDMLVAVLGVHKAGGAYAPVDPEYPAERIAIMLEDGGVRVLLTSRSIAPRLPATSATVLRLDESAPDQPATDSDRAPDSSVQPDHLGYVIFTSGSTGRPKAVAMPHRPLVNLLDWQIRVSSAGAGDRTLQFASLSFDPSYLEMYATWATGGTLVLVDEMTRRDATALLHLLDEQRIVRMYVPYIAVQGLADAAATAERVPGALREINTAGEQLQVTPGIVTWMQRTPGVVMFNQYGPSETHVVTALALTGDAAGWPALPSIGRPISNVTTYILDAHGQPVPIGVAGELYLGGVGVARGYLGRPDLSAERFVPDPFAAEAGFGTRVMYRSGDVARWRSGGEIEFLGRADHQVKIRGYRVELGEIEAVLAAHHGVRAAAVLARADARGMKRIVAYVVTDDGATDDVTRARWSDTLRAAVKARLPEFMVPSAVMVMSALPTTPSGKIDRKALPDLADAISSVPYRPPQNPVEDIVAGVWSDILNTSRVGADDDFFDLGGQSLLAMQAVSRLTRLFGRQITLRSIFEHSTIRAFAAMLTSDEATATRTAAVARALVRMRDMSPEERALRLQTVAPASPGDPPTGAR